MFQSTEGSDVEGKSGTGDSAGIKGDILTKSFTEGFYANIAKGRDGLKEASQYFADIGNALVSTSGILKTSRFLDDEQARLRGFIGLGSQKVDEFKKLIADGASKFASIGLETADVGKTYQALADTFKTDISVSDQDLLELGATAKVTNINAKDLAGGFRGVGISIQEVGENMTQVAEIARQAGVSVSAVSEQVVKNLDKMNIYNFEGGVKGLAKMSAQASKLGIDMSQIFTIVDKVFDPKGAIETAAAMQRLGVSANALLDPLRLMDLSQNDPTELQNQIVNMSKDFVRFNKELGQFEIMPGEKRRLNEIGKELGLADGAIQKMALNAANLDMKMKQIRFPSSIASKEDRELIATLAEVNAQGVAEIKVAKLDAEGNRTGEYRTVEASQLTVKELENIKKDQELRGKSMEEIAFDQLSEQTKLNSNFKSLVEAIGMGIATKKDVLAGYDFATTTTREKLFGDKRLGTEGFVTPMYTETETWRKFGGEKGTEVLANVAKTLVTDLSNVMTSLSSFDLTNFDFTGAQNMIDNLGKNIKDIFGGTYDYIAEKAKEFGIGGSTTDPYSNFQEMGGGTNTTLNKVEQKISSQSISQNLNAIEFKPIDINENIKVDVNVTMDPNLQNQALTTLISQGVEKWFTGAESNNNINLIRSRIMDVENRYNLTGPRLTNKD